MMVPKKTCDLCGKSELETYVDGRTKMGPWANMCIDCHDDAGCGFGMGRGQMYEYVGRGYVKVKG